MTLSVLLLFGCGQKLQGTTWEGKYNANTITYDFIGSDTAKLTMLRPGRSPDVDTFNYAMDGKLVKFTWMGTIGTLTLDDGKLVGTPADIDLGRRGLHDDTTTQVVLTKKK
jgi:hypothetical protein